MILIGTKDNKVNGCNDNDGTHAAYQGCDDFYK